ncbi:hypothetical protein SSX86_002363 [Deinandra increscens subsp. villosa]|uniref:FLZ-type domain-containing protein n=1 Tax=Deinandra increscens subsp. villosa TaxID=3103831 RepID=A0AAP0DP14_9ASTR
MASTGCSNHHLQESILSIDTMSNEIPTSSVPVTINEFFKHCFTCKKYIGEMVDIFIYMDMAFCSNECRSKKMDKDNEEKPKNPINKKKRSRKDYTPERAIIQ